MYLIVTPKYGPAPLIAHQRSRAKRLRQKSGASTCSYFEHTRVLIFVDDGNSAVGKYHLDFDKIVNVQPV